MNKQLKMGLLVGGSVVLVYMLYKAQMKIESDAAVKSKLPEHYSPPQQLPLEQTTIYLNT